MGIQIYSHERLLLDRVQPKDRFGVGELFQVLSAWVKEYSDENENALTRMANACAGPCACDQKVAESIGSQLLASQRN